MKILRIAGYLLLLPMFLFGGMASLEPTGNAPVHAGWLAFYSVALLTTIILLAREFRRTGGPAPDSDTN